MAPRPVLLVLLFALQGSLACRKSDPAGKAQAPAALESPALLPAWPCVHYEKLQLFLPKGLPGFKVHRDEASTGRYGEVSISEVQRDYFGEEGGELSIRIVDTSLVDQLGRAIRSAAREAEGQSADAHLSALQTDHAVGFVRFDRDQSRAEANLLVADRFVVAVTSLGLEGTGAVRQVAQGIDVDGLALLR